MSESNILEIGTNQKHLKEQSYKDASKLDVRILTHQKYTQPKIDFTGWVLDHIDWQGTETAIDVGCGSGIYADPTAARTKHYFACDLSHGMLLDGPAAGNHACTNLDAMQLPFGDNTADVLMANHMIYHIPNQERAMAEFRRVLKPSGTFIAVTNSGYTMKEYRQIRYEAFKNLGYDNPTIQQSTAMNFKLEDGEDLIKTAFDNVVRHDHESWLVFPDIQPVIDYFASSRDWYEKYLPIPNAWGSFEQSLRDLLTDHFAQHGEFRVSKKSGMFVCS